MDEIAGSNSRLTFGGLATGLDTGAIIEALLEAERRPLGLLEGRKASLESQRDALRTLSTNILTLRDAARKLDNRSSLFSGPSFGLCGASFSPSCSARLVDPGSAVSASFAAVALSGSTAVADRNVEVDPHQDGAPVEIEIEDAQLAHRAQRFGLTSDQSESAGSTPISMTSSRSFARWSALARSSLISASVPAGIFQCTPSWSSVVSIAISVFVNPNAASLT